MKKLLILFGLVALAGTAAQADEQDTVKRSAEILREFRSMPEHQVPRAVLRNARGLAIMRVVKVGFVFSGKGGDGVVIARTGNGWSGPSFIGTGGAGWGLQIGGQVTDFVFVLNNRDAIRAFSRGGNVTLGGDVSVAAGPVGRDIEANVAPKAAIYTYSLSKGSRPARQRRFTQRPRAVDAFFFTSRAGFCRLEWCGLACSSLLFLPFRWRAMLRSRSANWLTGF